MPRVAEKPAKFANVVLLCCARIFEKLKDGTAVPVAEIHRIMEKLRPELVAAGLEIDENYSSQIDKTILSLGGWDLFLVDSKRDRIVMSRGAARINIEKMGKTLPAKLRWQVAIALLDQKIEEIRSSAT